MDANLVFLFMAVISAGFTLWRVLFVFPRQYNRGWVVVCAVILVLAGIGWVAIPQRIGYIVGAAWVVFGIAPSTAQRLAMGYDRSNQFRLAVRWATVARTLHPAGQIRYMGDMYRARWLMAEGRFDEARRLLEGLKAYPPTLIFAVTTLYWLDGDYEGVRDWITRTYTAEEFNRDPNVVMRYLYALGMTGDLNRLVEAFQTYRGTLDKSSPHLNFALLYVFSACGCVPEVQQLLNGSLHTFSAEMKALWLGVTAIAAGQVEQGQSALSGLLNAADGQVRVSAKNVLARPAVNAQGVLSAESKAVLVQVAEQFRNDQRYERGRPAGQLKRQYVTLALAVVIGMVYLVEVQQGADRDLETLYRLGALWPPAVLQGGEWWRVVTVMFLHLGLLHVALNLVALLSIGSTVEAMLGRVRYLLVYFASGIGMALLVVWFTQMQWVEPMVYVGASGAIMGLIGAAAAIYLRDWRRSRSRMALNFLRRAALIIGLQVVADVAIPGTSLSGHLLGAVIGFVVTLLIYRTATDTAPA